MKKVIIAVIFCISWELNAQIALPTFQAVHKKQITTSILDLTPSTGSLIETDDPYWPNKGYKFNASQSFTISGGSWYFSLVEGGITRMNIYNSSGTLLSQGTNASGDGTEQWYQSDVSYTFQSGQTYTISFYTDRAESSLFDRKNSASGGYSVDGLVSNVYSRSGLNSSGGDNGSEAYPNSSNSWWPFQRLHVVE
jgi:hypothetical protein